MPAYRAWRGGLGTLAAERHKCRDDCVMRLYKEPQGVTGLIFPSASICCILASPDLARNLFIQLPPTTYHQTTTLCRILLTALLQQKFHLRRFRAPTPPSRSSCARAFSSGGSGFP